MEEVDEFGIPIKKTATKKKAVDEFGIPIKKKGSSEPTSQKGAGVSPTRPIQQGTSSDTEPPTRAQALVTSGGQTGSPFQSIDAFGGKGAVGAIVSEQQKTQKPSESYAVQVFKKAKSEVDENITEERLLEEKEQSGFLNYLGAAAKSIWNVTGTGLSSVNEALGGTKDYFVIDDYKPLQDEKKQAKRELQKEGLPVTDDNIQKRAEDIFRINDKRNQLEKRIDANLPEDYDRQGIWKELKLDNLKKNSSLKEAFISADVYKGQIKEFESYYNSLKNIPREQITQAQVDKYNDLLGNANESLEGLKYLDQKFPKMLEEVKSSDELLDVFKYNYNDYEKHLSNIKNFAKGIAGGTVKLMEETARYLDEKTGLDTDVYGFREGNIKMANEVLDEASEDREQFIKYKAKDISNFSDVGSFMAGLGTEQIPVWTTLAIAPELGPVLLGAGTGGEQFRTMEIEESQPFTKKTSFGQKLATSYMYGGAEALFERLGTVSVLKNIEKSIAKASNPSRKLIQDGAMQEVSKLGKQFGYNFGLEGGTEYLTAEAQIAADRYIAGKEISAQQANERRFESFVAGGLMGGGMTMIGGVWGAIAQNARIYSDNKDIKKTKEILSQIERLSDEIKNNPNLTPEERVISYKKMNELTNQSFDIVSKNAKKGKDFNAQETQFLVDINVKQAELKAKLQEIKDSNFSKEQKETFINELKDEYSKLEEKRNTTLQGNYNKLTELPSAEVIRLKDKAARELMKELNPDGTKTITINDSEITKRAIQLLESETKAPAAEEMSVKPSIESPIELKEGEELVDVKQDKKGNTYTYVAETSEKDGVKTTKFKFNRSDKSSEQRNPAGVDADKVLDKYGYEIAADQIQEGAEIIEINEIRKGEKTTGAIVTFKDAETGNRFKGEIILKPKVTEVKAEEVKPAEVKEPAEIKTKSGLDLPKVKDEINNSPVTDRDENNQDLKRFIPFSIIEEANKNDKLGGQTARQIAQRGGYSVLELDKLLPNWKEMLSGAKPTEVKADEVKPAEALKDVESTTKALEKLNAEDVKKAFRSEGYGYEDNKILAETYHKAKAEGSNPKLVKAVDELLAPEAKSTEVKAEEVKPTEALKDVESTKKALINDIVRKEGFDGSENQKKFFKASDLVPEEIWAESPKSPSDAIAEAYHKAKAEGTNPDLVKAVEELLAPTEVKTKVEIPEQHREERDRLIKEYEKDIADSKEKLKSEKERSFFSRSRSNIKYYEDNIKFFENEIKLLKENPIEFYKNWIKSAEETHNDRIKNKSKDDNGKTYKERVIENYGTTDFNVVKASFIEDFNKKISDYEAVQKTENENAKLKKPTETEATATEEIAPSEIETTLDEVITPASNNIKEQIARAKKAISKFLPNVEIVYHTTAESFQAVVGDNSRGYYDPATKKIHINGSNATKNTVSHEVFHAVVLKYISSDKQATDLTNRMFKALAKSIKNNPKLLKDINKFAESYSKGLQSEEKLAEVLGYLASEYETLPDVSKNIIQKWIEKIAKMVGIKKFTDQEVVDFMNTIATKVAYGQEITEADVSKVLESGKKVSSPSQLIRKQKVGSFDVEYTEKDKLDNLIKYNLVTEPENTDFMAGKNVAITSPDDMLAGSISLDGKKIFEGGGGVFFVTKYGDVWASGNKSTANTLANAINNSLNKNDDNKGYLVLTKGSDSKLLSSSSGVNSSLSILDSMIDNGLISLSDFRSAVSSAVKTFGGEISLRGSAKQLKEDVNKYFSNPKESTFQKRGDVLKKIIETIAQSKNTKINKDKIIDFLGGDKNKGIVSKTTSENKNRNQSLSDLIAGVASENLTKGLNVGDVYAIIEVNGEVKVKEDSHPSYPFHIVQVDGNKPVLHLPKLRENGSKTMTTSSGKAYSVGNVSIMSGTFNDVSGRKQISPENSSNYANMTEDGKGNFVFYHFGPRGIGSIDPKKYGSNKGAITSKPEVAAMGRVGGMSQFYTMPEFQESNVSGDKYMIKVPMDKVYDFNTDPDNFYDRAKEIFKRKHPDLPFTANDQLAHITKLAEKAGYDMTVAEWNNMSRAQSTKALKPVDTQVMDGNTISKPFNEDYESNATKGFEPIIPTSKEAKLKDVYQKINAERNAKNRYDSLYSLAEDFPKLSQEKITDMIESSDISQEMKDAYAEALAYEPGARMSGRRQKSPIDTAVETAKRKGFNDKEIADYLVGKGYTRAQATKAILRYNDVTAKKLRKEDSVFTKDGRNKIVTFLDQVKRRALSAKSFLPKSVFLAKDKIESNIKAEAKRASYLVDDFNRLVKKYKGDIDVLHDEFDKYLRGDQTAVLPDEFKVVAGKMRMHIDNLSQMLLRTGAVSVSQAETIAANLGQYINRSYQVFDKKDWAKQVTEEMKEAARVDLRNMYRAEAESKAKQTGMDADIILEDFINKKIDELIGGESAATFLGISKTGAKNLGIMKERLDIPLSIRQLMGEYTDASQNYARTVLKIATLAENARFLQSARESGMGVFFFNENDPNRPKEFNTKIAGDKSDTMSPLNGLYTTPEIAKAFAQKIGTGDAIEAALGTELGPIVRSVYETYMKALSSVKWLKTIGSVATHMKNVTGNVWFMLSNGYYNPKKYAEAFRVLKNSSNEELRDKLDEYIRAGIIDQSAALGEIKAMFADADFETAIDNRLKKNPFQKVKAGARKLGQKMTTAYQLEDDFFKIISYESEKARYSKASFDKPFNELTVEQQNIIKDKASEITKNVLPNYARIPGLVKLLKAVPVTGTFVSFQSEAYRTAWNTVALAVDELRSDNKKIKAIGALRLSGIAMSQAAKFGLMAFMGTIVSGGDDDEDDELKKNTKLFVAPWSKDSDLVLVDYGGGKMSYIDFSASDPHGGIKKAYNAAMSGKDMTESFTNGLTQLLEPFMKEDMLLNVITDIKDNKNAYGGKLYNESDTEVNKINAIMGRVYKAFEPGTITTVRKIVGSDDVRNELAGQLTGYKIITVDVNKQLGFKMNGKDGLKDLSGEAKRLYSSAFYKFEDGSITGDELDKIYDQANKSQKEVYNKMMDYMKAASFFGVDDYMIEDNMQGVGKSVINDLWYGEAPDMKMKEVEE